MIERLDVLKTYKLFIEGKFPRSESGRSMVVRGADGLVRAHVCLASRKDLRDAVEAARKAQPGWANATAYNRGQVLYRMAEMLEGKRREFAEVLAGDARDQNPRAGRSRAPAARRGGAHTDEVAASIDRLVYFAGWADKYAQVLGCNNPVAGPYYNFTVPEPAGVVAVVTPDRPPLLSLISLIAPVLCAGNTVVALASEKHPIAAALLGEVCATSDVPAGVVNLLTGDRGELLGPIAAHRDIDAIAAAGLDADQSRVLREGAAENVKRVRVWDVQESPGGAGSGWWDQAAWQSPWRIEPFVEMKTIWHPSAV